MLEDEEAPANSRVFVLGGALAHGQPSAEVFSYAAGDKYWREEHSMHRPRAGAHAPPQFV